MKIRLLTNSNVDLKLLMACFGFLVCAIIFTTNSPRLIEAGSSKSIATPRFVSVPKSLVNVKPAPAIPVAMKPTPQNVIPTLVAPAVISRVMPAYPLSKRESGESAQIVAQILVGIDGQPKSVEITQSSGFSDFDNSAISALQKWRFNPARQNGAAVEVKYQVPVRFEISGS